MSVANLGFLLQDVTRLLRCRFDRIVRETSLTRSQWRAISCLARSEGMSQAALAEVLEIEPITLTRLIDRMQAKGFVERRPHPRDRRSWSLHLTAAARPLLDELETYAAIARAEAFRNVATRDLLALESALGVIKANLRPLCHTACVERGTAHG